MLEIIITKKDEVLDRLGKLADLPMSGFLAGGAPANMLLGIMDNADYPINDIDIFSKISVPLKTYKSIDSAEVTTAISLKTLKCEHYWQLFPKPNITADKNYKIFETTRDGLINSITIGFDDEPDGYDAILSTFDLNCCQIGIDLETRSIYVTDNFVEFVKTRQLMVCTNNTPAHTAVRLAKKASELNCSCDFEAEYGFLATTAALFECCYRNSDLVLNDHYADMYNTYMFGISQFAQLYQTDTNSFSLLFDKRLIHPEALAIANLISTNDDLIQLQLLTMLMRGSTYQKDLLLQVLAHNPPAVPLVLSSASNNFTAQQIIWIHQRIVANGFLTKFSDVLGTTEKVYDAIVAYDNLITLFGEGILPLIRHYAQEKSIVPDGDLIKTLLICETPHTPFSTADMPGVTEITNVGMLLNEANMMENDVMSHALELPTGNVRFFHLALTDHAATMILHPRKYTLVGVKNDSVNFPLLKVLARALQYKIMSTEAVQIINNVVKDSIVPYYKDSLLFANNITKVPVFSSCDVLTKYAKNLHSTSYEYYDDDDIPF